MKRPPNPDPEEGVSVIVGTLLLILVTVTASMGLAIMLSGLQKQEMERQSHQQAVKNEELKVLGIKLNNKPEEWAESPDINWTNMTGWFSAGHPCYFDKINGSIKDISLSNWTTHCWKNWSSINLTLLNMNTESSSIINVAVNDKFSRNITTVYRIPIRGTKSAEITVNLTKDFHDGYRSLVIGPDSEIRIRVVTSLYNIFERTFRPPTAMVRVKTETDYIGKIERDVLVLDGSESFDDGNILKYNWKIYNVSGPIGEIEGKIARKIFRASDLFNTTSIIVQLHVTDDTGMIGASQNITIPVSKRFAPLVRITPPVKKENPDRIEVTLFDSFDDPMNDIDVMFYVIEGNITFDKNYCISGSTGAPGVAVANITGGKNGRVKVMAEQVAVEKYFEIT